MGCGASAGGSAEADAPATSQSRDAAEPMPSAIAMAAAAAEADAGGPLRKYPMDFASEAMEVARDAGLVAAGDADQQADIDESLEEMKADNVFTEAELQQFANLAACAGDAAASELLGGGDGLEEKQQAFNDAREPKPEAISEELWKRTYEMCWSASLWACAEQAGDDARAAKEKRAFERHGRAIKGFGPGMGPSDPAAFGQRVDEIMPSNVIMFSGCKDSQTSADVSNTASFGLPSDAGPGGAGGACTNSMIKALHEQSEYTWAGLLKRMREILEGKYTQIPQMSSSKNVDMNTQYSVKHFESSGRFRALLVGINYVGTSAELAGCHNDVETMRRYLEEQGYPEGEVRLLLDDGEHDAPDKANIEAGFSWLVEGAGAGDSLFFHYSGHGASIRDDDSDEPDGKDEALCPSDYESAGLIRDDDVFKLLVAPLPEGAKLTCVLDCCHSGTILDLPFMFRADDQSLSAVENGQSGMTMNPGFDFGKMLQVFKENPVLAVGAAIGGAALMCMGSERRGKVKGLVDKAGGQEQLMGMISKGVGGDKAQLLSLAQGFF